MFTALSRGIHRALIRHWYVKKCAPMSCLLLPLSWLYRCLFVLHRWLVLRHKNVTSSVPVIVVGNLTVGGTGKTPLVIWLLQHLKAQGHQPGCISRGYGGVGCGSPQWVLPTSCPRDVGDEPVLIAQKTQLPVVVCTDRCAALSLLCTQTECDIVVSDDGLQHHRLPRSLEVIVVDQRQWGNGYCLPMGPLRVSPKQMPRTDFVVQQGGTSGLAFELVPDVCYPLALGKQESWLLKDLLKTIRCWPVYLVAGIGNPDNFFKLVGQYCPWIEPHAFPDHHRWTAKDIDLGHQDSVVLMTEKDAVKCAPFADGRHWVLSVKAVPNSDFCVLLAQNLEVLLLKK